MRTTPALSEAEFSDGYGARATNRVTAGAYARRWAAVRASRAAAVRRVRLRWSYRRCGCEDGGGGSSRYRFAVWAKAGTFFGTRTEKSGFWEREGKWTSNKTETAALSSETVQRWPWNGDRRQNVVDLRGDCRASQVLESLNDMLQWPKVMRECFIILYCLWNGVAALV